VDSVFPSKTLNSEIPSIFRPKPFRSVLNVTDRQDDWQTDRETDRQQYHANSRSVQFAIKKRCLTISRWHKVSSSVAVYDGILRQTTDRQTDRLQYHANSQSVQFAIKKRLTISRWHKVSSSVAVYNAVLRRSWRQFRRRCGVAADIWRHRVIRRRRGGRAGGVRYCGICQRVDTGRQERSCRQRVCR